jgi:hypothetical protein
MTKTKISQWISTELNSDEEVTERNLCTIYRFGSVTIFESETISYNQFKKFKDEQERSNQSAGHQHCKRNS